MALEVIKKYIKSGSFYEARKLIEKVDKIDNLMSDGASPANGVNSSPRNSTYQDKNADNLPLMVMLSLIKDEESALGLSRLLLEKGYNLGMCDQNGLCALNYAIALKRFKLLSLFLSSFNFELNTYEDCYRNTFLHYAFATNNKDIIGQFHDTYAKYYEWDEGKFKYMRNVDGLSLKDLGDYYAYTDKREAYMKRMRMASIRDEPLNSSTNGGLSSTRTDQHFDMNSGYKVPDCFKMNSNPIIICSYINKIFKNTNSNLSTELLFLSNSKNYDELALASNVTARQPDLKLNLLYQIKTLNKPNRPQTTAAQKKKASWTNSGFPCLVNSNSKFHRSSLFSPINTSEHMPRKGDYESYKQLTTDEIEIKPLHIKRSSYNESGAAARSSATWRADIKKIFGDYSTITSPSYRVSTAVLQRATNNVTCASVSSGALNTQTPAPTDNRNGPIKESVSSPSVAGVGGDVGSNHTIGSGSNSGKSTRMNNVYVIKPANPNPGDKGGDKSKAGSGVAGQGNGGAQNQKFDIYMVPGLLVNNGKKAK
jgi:hypothetical protein